METAEKDDRANIGDVRSFHERKEVPVQLVEEFVSRLVNGFTATTRDTIMISEQEPFSLVAWLSLNVKFHLHHVGHVRWISKQMPQHHPFGWEVSVTV